MFIFCFYERLYDELGSIQLRGSILFILRKACPGDYNLLLPSCLALDSYLGSLDLDSLLVVIGCSSELDECFFGYLVLCETKTAGKSIRGFVL